jgi:hypothetical protein
VTAWAWCKYCGMPFAVRPGNVKKAGCCCREHARLFEAAGRRPPVDETTIRNAMLLIEEDLRKVLKGTK